MSGYTVSSQGISVDMTSEWKTPLLYLKHLNFVLGKLMYWFLS